MSTNLRTILIATDFSDQARAAGDWAMPIAGALGAKSSRRTF